VFCLVDAFLHPATMAASKAATSPSCSAALCSFGRFPQLAHALVAQWQLEG
jgi:hypothetical protein